MAIREVRIAGDEILTKKSKEVKEIIPRVRELIEDMYETMYEENGVGLAAPQVGILKRIVVIDVGEGGKTFINPELVEQSGSQTGDEGCLSLPGKVGTVTRPSFVKVKAYDEDMEEFMFEAEGFFARAICHELDHLDGVLYTEHVEGDLRNAGEEE